MADETIVEEPTGQSGQVEKATWSAAFVNDLPNGSFLYIEPGADTDGEGKTTPRSKRHFPYKDASGKVDLPHLRNAIARIPQSNAPGLTPEKKRSLQERARKLLGNQDKDMYDEGMANEYYPLYGVTSFAELDDLQQAEEAGQHAKTLTEQFQMMVGNIMHDPGITNKGTAINQLTSEFTMRLKQPIRRKSNLIDAVRNLFAKKEVEDKAAEPADSHLPAQITAPFMVWKDANTGQYRWFAVYSNQFRDEDNPPEIISEKSHKAFVDLVHSGAVDYPELWHWHIPGTTWGKADWLDYADGFAIASGTVDPGHEKEAEALSQMDDIRVSHGMPSRFIVRSKEDPSIIDFHITSEISPLPGWAAANPLTGFVVMDKELSDMTEVKGIRPEQKEHLLKLGWKQDKIDDAEKMLSAMAKAATDAGLESKETTPVADVPAETPAATPEAPAYVTAQEVADVVTAMNTAFADALSTVTSKIDAMHAEMKALKESDEQKIAKASDATPRASLQALIAHSIGGMAEAQIDGRTVLAKASPKQAPNEPEAITGFSYIDQMIAQSRTGVEQ